MKKLVGIIFVCAVTSTTIASNPTLRVIHDQTLSTIDQCCSQIDSDFSGTWTIIQEITSKIDTVSCSGDSNVCQATAIDSVPTTISSAGSYCLAQNVTVSSGTGITITADNVVLDLNHHTVVGTGGTTGISINGDRVTIFNGIICNMNGAGITLQGNNCTVASCNFVNNGTGVTLENANLNYIHDCIAQDNHYAGFSLLSSSTNYIFECQALGTGSNATSYGFTSSSGSTNLFQNCIADGTHSISTATTDLVAGFALRGLEQKTKIINCRVDGTSTLSISTVSPYGILLASDFLAEQVNTFASHDEHVIDWSPDGTYLAGSPSSGSDTGILRIRKFENETFTTVTSYTPTPTSDGVSYPAWSPDGQYIAELGDYRGTPSYTIAVYHFDANGTETITQRAALDYPGTVGSLGGIDHDNSPSWSPSGKFFAVFDSANSEMVIFEFDTTTDSITTRTAISVPDGSQAHWSSTGYLATAEVDTSGAPTIISTLKIYTFNELTYDLILTTAATETKTDAHFPFVRWSPNGAYILWHGFVVANNIDNMLVYQFQEPSTLTKISEQYNDTIDSFFGSTNYTLFSAWSPNNNYFVITGYPTTDGSNDYLAALYHLTDQGVIQYLVLFPSGLTRFPFPAWSSQNYLALSAPGLVLFDAESAVGNQGEDVQSCFVKDTIVGYTSGGNNLGVGIVGAINNALIGNYAIANDTNYQGVNNVHSGVTGTPNILDNISL